MSRAAFRIGDLVELKSGSPDMTVTAVTAESVCLAWCGGDDSGVLHQTELPIAAIQLCRDVTPQDTSRPRSPPIGGGYGSRGPLPPNFDDEIPF